jgi:hypothetical protein
MRTRRRRLPRTRAAARLPGSLKFGVTNDASANPCDGKSGFTRRGPRHRAGAVFTSMPRAGPRVLFIDDIILYRDDARQPLCPGLWTSLVEDASSARMSATTPSRPGSAPSPPDGSGRAREPPGSYARGQSRSFQSFLVLTATGKLYLRVRKSRMYLKPQHRSTTKTHKTRVTPRRVRYKSVQQ